ncbi:MAG: amino acid permease [Nitrosarchaeum sp.]|nr:MAG: amino acid permease [Nitrosarchaeum sp.]
MNLKKRLSSFDLTNLIIGSVIGADIYITPGLTAAMIGPASIVVWVVAGVFALVIALVFSYTSYYVPKVGGPFAFVSKAFGKFYGFLAGWLMLIAEMMALPLFAIVFTRYLHFFIELDSWQEVLVKGLFIFSLTTVNILGVKLGGRVNDVLTLMKLAPLVLVIALGFIFLSYNPENLSQNYSPIAPLGWENFGPALVLIFWAYAGFEMGTLPASEVKNPKRVIPKAITIGMILVTLFYLSTNFVLYGSINWIELSHSTLPLVLAGTLVIGYVGGVIVSFGALTSVTGTSSSFVLGVSRLYYAMSSEGLFPKVFSKVHKRYKTPFMALIIQGIIAFFLSMYAGISQLISFSVFNMAIMYLLVCLSLIVLKKEETKFIGQKVLPFVGIAICVFLIYSTTVYDKIFGTLFVILGIGIYFFFSRKNNKSYPEL